MFLSAGYAPARQVDIRSFRATCDGSTDDGPAVQAALNGLSPGDTLLVSCRAGIGSGGLSIRDRRDLTIRGVNGGGFKALAPASLASQGFSPVMFLVQGCRHCVIESLQFEMNGVGEAAIGLDRCSDSSLRQNVVVDTGFPASAAIVATGNRQVAYIGNRVLRTGSSATNGTRGMWLGNGDDPEEEWSPEVAGNVVESAGATGIVVYARGAVIKGNAVSRCKGAGLKLIARSLPAGGAGAQTRIENNTLTKNSFHGLQIERGEGGVLINHNIFDENTIAGLYASGGNFTGTIADNTFSGNREAGIYLYMANALEIRGNRFTAGRSAPQGHGILLEAIQANSIRDVDISGNSIWDQTQSGISIWARGGVVAGLRIASNSIGGRSPVGVRIEDAAGKTADRISLASNCFDRQLARTLLDQRIAPLPAPVAAACPGQPSITTKGGRPE
jgi:parallel beta-helix repeat protein